MGPEMGNYTRSASEMWLVMAFVAHYSREKGCLQLIIKSMFPFRLILKDLQKNNCDSYFRSFPHI